MYQEVHGSPRAGIPPMPDGRTLVRHGVRALSRMFADWREQRAAIAELRGLSDRHLRDLGIERQDIPSVVASRAAANRR